MAARARYRLLVRFRALFSDGGVKKFLSFKKWTVVFFLRSGGLFEATNRKNDNICTAGSRFVDFLRGSSSVFQFLLNHRQLYQSDFAFWKKLTQFHQFSTSIENYDYFFCFHSFCCPIRPIGCTKNFNRPSLFGPGKSGSCFRLIIKRLIRRSETHFVSESKHD